MEFSGFIQIFDQWKYSPIYTTMKNGVTVSVTVITLGVQLFDDDAVTEWSIKRNMLKAENHSLKIWLLCNRQTAPEKLQKNVGLDDVLFSPVTDLGDLNLHIFFQSRLTHSYWMTCFDQCIVLDRYRS